MMDLLAQSAVAAFLRQSGWAYPFVNSLHILAIGLLVGAITTLDLKLLGLFRNSALSALAPPLVRIAQAGVALALLTGLLLFSVQPSNYLQNSAFLIKLALVTLAIINALLVHRLPAWQTAINTGTIKPALHVTAVMSLGLWILAVFAGRWIAFV